MHVDSVSNYEHGDFNSRITKKAADHPKKGHEKTELPDKLMAPGSPDEGQHHDDQDRGVIRLLEEGHFKGVADVRLRINFFDELSARASTQSNETLSGQMQSLVDQVAGAFANTQGILALDEQGTAAANQLMEDFKTVAQDAAGAAETNGTLDSQALQAKLSEAFATLIDGLRTLTASPEPQPETPDQLPATDVSAPAPVDVTVPTDSTEVSASSLSTDQVLEPTTDVPVELPQGDTVEVDPFTSLTEAFNSAIITMNESLAAIVRLPDPSPPTGHGTAYDKFLAIYNSLRAGTSAGAGEQDSPNVEVSA